MPLDLVLFVSGLLAAHRAAIGTRGVLAERAPGLREALERALAEGARYVIQDGTLIRSDRRRDKTTGQRYGKEIGTWYSGKKKAFGGNIPDQWWGERERDQFH
jgi:hypothetical protein